MDCIYYLLAGIVLGWLIKAPFLIRYYRRIRRDKEHIGNIVDRIKR